MTKEFDHCLSFPNQEVYFADLLVEQIKIRAHHPDLDCKFETDGRGISVQAAPVSFYRAAETSRSDRSTRCQLAFLDRPARPIFDFEIEELLRENWRPSLYQKTRLRVLDGVALVCIADHST